MKICIVTHKVTKGDGQGRVNYEIVLEALRRGHEVTVLASEIDDLFQIYSAFKWIPISVAIYPSEFLKNIVFSIKASRWLKHHQSAFDIVKLNGAITSVTCHVNVAHFVHSSWLNSPAHTSKQQLGLYGFYQWLYTFFNSYWEKQAFQRAETIVAVSTKVKQEIQQLGFPSDKIEVILNGVDLTEFHSGSGDRFAFNLPDQVPLGLFVGDIRSNRKNLETVLRAMQNIPNLHLVVVGDTNQSPYPTMANNWDLSDRVHFVGFRRDVAAIMRVADFFVFPSRYEACTLVLLEAMASGLPVITAATAGGSEIVTADCGFVVEDSEDIAGITLAMEYLTHETHQRQVLGKAARQVAERHSWQATGERYLRLFETQKQTYEEQPILFYEH